MSKIIEDEEFDLSSSSDEGEDNENYDDDLDNDFDDDENDILNDDENDDETLLEARNKSLNYEINGEEYEDEDVYNENEYLDNEPIENYLQKINDNMKSNIISDFHPQLKPHNYEEIQLLTKIKRDKNGDIIDDLHKTSPFMTKYELTRILAERTVQINSGASTFLDETDKIDGYLIAFEELNKKKIPFIVKRPLPNGSFEYWNANDLELL